VGRQLAQISGKQLTANNFGLNDALFQMAAYGLLAFVAGENVP
jgi:hypothetical protein